MKTDNDNNCTETASGWWPFFSFSRSEQYPTRYQDNKTAAHTDVLTAGLIFAFVIVAICFYAILPAYRRARGCQLFLYITISLFIGGVVVVANYGHEWEVGQEEIRAQYKAGSAEEIDAKIGLHIALRGINITLKGAPTLGENSTDLKGETIDYNEHFSWEWVQGRFGFGKYAGQIARDFRAKVIQGLPYPILQVAEYFTFDGEWIRFGRYYRMAGFYAHIFMWTAFPLWILTNILFCMNINRGCFCLFLTGLSQLVAVLVWTYHRNPIEIGIPFEKPLPHNHSEKPEDRDVILVTRFGPDYYLVLGNSILCVVLAGVIYLCNETIPDEMCAFFGIDPVSMYLDDYPESGGVAMAPPSPKVGRLLGMDEPSTEIQIDDGSSTLRRRPQGTFVRSIQHSFKASGISIRRKKRRQDSELEMDPMEKQRLLSPPTAGEKQSRKPSQSFPPSLNN